MQISIVMTVYNGEEYVAESVQSILDQTYRDFEFIIVDDCSTDRTAKILKKFSDPRVRIFTLLENKGQTFSLNYGIEQAKGEWIFRQDADDISLPERLARQVEFIKEHPDAVAVGTLIRAIPSKKTTDAQALRAIEWSNALVTRKDIKKFRFIAPPVVHGSVAFSKEAFLQAGRYNESYRIGQDLDLWIRLLEIGPIDKVPEVLYHYRIDPDSISRKDETKTCRESLAAATCHIRRQLEQKLGRDPVFIISGPMAGCEYFRREIAPANSLSVLTYTDEKNLPVFELERADAIIILDGKHSEGNLAALEQTGLVFNDQLFRLWNIYIEDAPTIKESRPNQLFASVIVPCYNAEATIRNTILSLKHQTYPQECYEIIVVDDASKDNSYEILKSIEAPNLKLFRHRKNKGAAAARNTGTRYAKGEILIFCDSDFLVPPTFIESHTWYHTGQEMLAVSGMGHWHYVLTSYTPKKWSAYERTSLMDFYSRPLIAAKLEKGELMTEVEIKAWQIEPYLFCPDYLRDWVQMAGAIYERYGPELNHFRLPWLTFCTGNLSLRKADFFNTGGFDESFNRLEDWEFGYRFYKGGGKFRFAAECEAFQQLGPISPKRREAQRSAYHLFARKHPDFAVHLLALLLFSNASFTELSTMYDQHEIIKLKQPDSARKMERTRYRYASGKRLNKDDETLPEPSQFPEWAALYQTLHGKGG
jgi:glycosyltransferase involved in cell wall biosynthesis